MQIKETIGVSFPRLFRKPAARRRRGGPEQPRRHGDRLHAVTTRQRIPHRQPSDGCADVVAGANTWRPVQRWSS